MSNLCNKEFEGLMGNTYRRSNDAGHSGCCTAWVNRETGETHGWPVATGSGEPKWVKCVSTGHNWRAHDAGVLEVGKSYEVADYNQSEDHTEYALTEFPDKWFNALNFDPLSHPTREPAHGHTG